MRFMHLADVHLGADPDSDVLNSINRKEEIWDTFRRAAELAQQEGVELLLIAGDLFHRQPLFRDLEEVDYILSEIYTGKTVIIAGNRDYLKENSNYRTFKWNDNVTMLWGLEAGKMLDKVFFPQWNLEVYGFSYNSPEITQGLYDGTLPDDNGALHILLAHGGDDKHVPISKEFLNGQVFDYVALGHLHKPGMAKTGKYAYSGCPEPTGRSDLGARGCIICDIERDENGVSVVSPRFLKLASRIYYHENITISRSDTNFGALLDSMSGKMQELGQHNLYKWTISGYRSNELNIDIDQIKSLGNVVEVIDKTKLTYDLGALLKGHRNDIVGLYIQSFFSGENGKRTPEDLDEIEEQALYLGIQAMLEK